MFTLPVLAALAVVAVVTSFISGIFGMAGGMLLIGFLLVLLPVPVAMVFHGVIQIAANGWRSWLWRHHINWNVVLQFGLGSGFSLAVFSSFAFVPPKALVLITIGVMPFIALAVPVRFAPNIERRGQAFAAGAIGGALQLVAGVTGPILDMFYVAHRHDAADERLDQGVGPGDGALDQGRLFRCADRRPGRPRPRAMAR